MKDFVEHINSYAALLKSAAVWQNSNEVLAPVTGVDGTSTVANDYIYEFYCYISILVDLKSNYRLHFIEGKDEFKYNFPKKAAKKKGKPRFHVFQGEELVFQVCAGTMIRCKFATEKNHPDISFQIAEASEDPVQDDLIIIMDAKFSERPDSRISKGEYYKFAGIIDVFDLRKKPTITIKFEKLKKLYGNCLITNAMAYKNASDLSLSKAWSIKEVQNFTPKNRMQVIG